MILAEVHRKACESLISHIQNLVVQILVIVPMIAVGLINRRISPRRSCIVPGHSLSQGLIRKPPVVGSSIPGIAVIYLFIPALGIFLEYGADGGVEVEFGSLYVRAVPLGALVLLRGNIFKVVALFVILPACKFVVGIRHLLIRMAVQVGAEDALVQGIGGIPVVDMGVVGGSHRLLVVDSHKEDGLGVGLGLAFQRTGHSRVGSRAPCQEVGAPDFDLADIGHPPLIHNEISWDHQISFIYRIYAIRQTIVLPSDGFGQSFCGAVRQSNCIDRSCIDIRRQLPGLSPRIVGLIGISACRGKGGIPGLLPGACALDDNLPCRIPFVRQDDLINDCLLQELLSDDHIHGMEAPVVPLGICRNLRRHGKVEILHPGNTVVKERPGGNILSGIGDHRPAGVAVRGRPVRGRRFDLPVVVDNFRTVNRPRLTHLEGGVCPCLFVIAGSDLLIHAGHIVQEAGIRQKGVAGHGNLCSYGCGSAGSRLRVIAVRVLDIGRVVPALVGIFVPVAGGIAVQAHFACIVPSLLRIETAENDLHGSRVFDAFFTSCRFAWVIPCSVRNPHAVIRRSLSGLQEGLELRVPYHIGQRISVFIRKEGI